MSDVLTGFIVAFEAQLDEEGWDAVPMVLAGVADDDGTMMLDVVGRGDPYEILESCDASGVAVYVVSLEGWSWPPGLAESARVGRPSEHPDRVEVRSVLAVARSGAAISVTRERGEEPCIEEGCRGPLVDAMATALESTFR